MKVLLTLLFVLTATFAQAQSIIKNLERNIPGQGKVTIHQDPRIEALIGMAVSYTHLTLPTTPYV